jgi:hypothetical protein
MTPAPPSLSEQATFYIPKPYEDAATLLNRWSDTYVQLPAALAVPYTEDDVITLIEYAKQNKFCLLVASGRHLTSVPVDSKTLYVDLKNFSAVRINESAKTVSVSGGATTKSVLDVLTAAGYYTATPNTNSVGYVGAFLGGGSSVLNSVNGFIIDHVVTVTLFTSAGEKLVISAESTGEKNALWHTLRGAGHGLGVVTELTMKIYPVSELKMEDDKVWFRTLVFPAPALAVAAAAYEELQPVQGPIGINLILQRAPPGSPAADSPIIVMTASYFGPAAEAEKKLAVLLKPEVAGAAFVATTSFLPLTAVNDGTKAIEIRGGNKRSEATLLTESVTAETVQRAFSRFLQLGADAPDTLRSGIVFYSFDRSAISSNGQEPELSNGFFEGRNTQTIVYHDVWFKDSADIVDVFLPESIGIVRSGESGPVRRFVNFVQNPAKLTDHYSDDKIAEKRRVKQLWDPENIFWAPGFSSNLSQSL